MTTDRTDYGPAAELYDEYFDAPHDIPRVSELARRYGPPVLDIACGTGRVAITLAQSGIAVDGVDISEQMLAVARRKGARLPLRFFAMDAAGFALNRSYGLICITNGSFMHLLSDERQRSCLQCANAHLRHGGGLLLDVIVDEPPSAYERVTHEENWYWASRDLALRVHATYETAARSRIVSTNYSFTTTSGETVANVDYAYRIPDMLALLDMLVDTGFDMVASHAGYSLDDTRKRKILIAQKRRDP